VPDSQRTTRLARAVLGISGGPADDLVTQLGVDLARAQGTELVAVHVVEVDWRHDLDDEMTDSRQYASNVLDLASGVAERARVNLRTQLLQARDVGAALVDEAVALGADAIVLGLPYRKRFGGDFAMGRTVPYAFQNAPCRVLVVREPVARAESRDSSMRRD
jgi:nucleotide-binding universal stress UspA family protein